MSVDGLRYLVILQATAETSEWHPTLKPVRAATYCQACSAADKRMPAIAVELSSTADHGRVCVVAVSSWDALRAVPSCCVKSEVTSNACNF